MCIYIYLYTYISFYICIIISHKDYFAHEFWPPSGLRRAPLTLRGKLFGCSFRFPLPPRTPSVSPLLVCPKGEILKTNMGRQGRAPWRSSLYMNKKR